MASLRRPASPRTLSTLFSSCIALAIFALLSGKLSVWDLDGPELFGSSGIIAVPVLLIAAILGLVVYRKGMTLHITPEPFAGALVAVFLSDWLNRGYNLLQGPSIRGEIILGSLLSVLLLMRRPDRGIELFSVFAGLFLAAAFLSESSGRILFSDDHPVFLYRLLLLREHFPFIPFYNPLWNGGIDSRDFFATGALNIFFLLAPLIYSIDLLKWYQVLVALLLFAIVPLAMVLACRFERLDSRATALAAVLTLTNNLLWYRWALKYGTMGFICSAALIPLVFVLASRTIREPQEMSRLEIATLMVSFTLMIFWSLTGLVFVPLMLAALFRLPALIHVRRVRRAGLLLIAFNLPWIVLFVTVSKVFSFLDSSTIKERRVVHAAPVSSGAALHGTERGSAANPAAKLKQSALRTVREWAVSANPLILFLGLRGIGLLTRARRTHLLLMLGWTALLGAVGPFVRPQLELDRMLLVTGLLLAIPAARAMAALLDRARDLRTASALLLASLCGGFLIAAVWSSAGVLMNRSIEQYSFASPQVWNLSRALREARGSGRILFAGFVLHELNEGHLAPLIFTAGRPLIASSFAHDKWRYTDVIPDDFRSRGDAGIEEFLDLYNVTSVVVHDQGWRRYFGSRPERYHREWSDGEFILFERRVAAPTYFHSGSGSIVTQETDRIVLTLESSDAVLKFNYFPFLSADRCSVEPAPAGGNVTLIGLRHCPTGVPITIRSLPPWYRFRRS